MMKFGTGLTLREANPWLRDDESRRARILDVTERNSVIEGLPPMSEEIRRQILKQLVSIDERGPEPGESA